MDSVRLDHVALLVRNLDDAVNDYRSLLSILDPSQAAAVVLDGTDTDDGSIRWATFVSAGGGTVLQLIESSLPADKALLEKRGECIHHIAFHSTDVDGTIGRLAEIGVTPNRLGEHSEKPWLKWALIRSPRTHGATLEVAQAYRVVDGAWVPKQ